MSKIEERDLFFEHIKKIYMQNPNFKVTPDTIYNELKLFNVQDGKQMRISNDNLIKIQARLSNYFRKREPAICFSKGPFFAIENRNGYDDKTFYDKINTYIKLYIACDKKNLYNVTGLVFNYMIDVVYEINGYEPEPGSITVCNYHKSKGMEWDQVFLLQLILFRLNNVELRE